MKKLLLALACAAFALPAAPAGADPEFPDIDSLPMTAVKYPDGFSPTDGKQWPVENIFSPAEGVYCRLRLQAWGNFQMPPADVACVGDLPGMPNGENVARIDIEGNNEPTVRFLNGANNVGNTADFPHFSTGKQFQVFLNVPAILLTCGSGDGNAFLFACRARQSLGQERFPPHGFVLSKHGSWTF
ncbi:hypothetical protein [Segniliparus rugosus]|uniref:Uncharacterized protein n=1 Tax=Segniliparus rugosus (strain ATCC BAA-974 / DSM 45345 / CCUG 50838 / CIP 108380 / JCM 13579 / CDC 945) TaxID=679197 RepID=E5XLE6_SEGRC|nr:hypothetical protein [Segniliparus rugosus]EFV14829.1 hypothetical protein HMPREF9336_00315 [Segniliparus rugosus ATCC BAA-974]